MAPRLPLSRQRTTQDAKPRQTRDGPVGARGVRGVDLVVEVPLLGEGEQVEGENQTRAPRQQGNVDEHQNHADEDLAGALGRDEPRRRVEQERHDDEGEEELRLGPSDPRGRRLLRTALPEPLLVASCGARALAHVPAHDDEEEEVDGGDDDEEQSAPKHLPHCRDGGARGPRFGLGGDVFRVEGFLRGRRLRGVAKKQSPTPGVDVARRAARRLPRRRLAPPTHGAVRVAAPVATEGLAPRLHARALVLERPDPSDREGHAVAPRSLGVPTPQTPPG